MESIGSLWLWGGFLVFVLCMLALDLGVFHKKSHQVTFKEAAIWSIVWVTLAMIFNAGIWVYFGSERALEFLTGYVLEKSLSVDNIFVFVLIFSAFAVPQVLQHRVLFWGVLGALILRAIFIFAGAALIAKFHWLLYIFGGLLVVTGLKLLKSTEESADPNTNPLVRLFRKIIPTVDRYDGDHFFTIVDGKRYATLLLVALVAIEASDLLFAIDSIPAIFAVTRDPFIVFTSNIFAILGLRSLYFLLAEMMDRFHYLKTGLAVILTFVGTKMLLLEVYKIPISLSLGFIALTLVVAVVASLRRPLAGAEKKHTFHTAE
jgi:tellurite resistance protein TerC